VTTRGCIQKFPDWVITKDNKNNKINTRWEATEKVMAAKFTRLIHKIAIQLHLVAESCTICSSRSKRPVRKLLSTPSYIVTSLVQGCPTVKLLRFLVWRLGPCHCVSYLNVWFAYRSRIAVVFQWAEKQVTFLPAIALETWRCYEHDAYFNKACKRYQLM
jgi:hypothetical protein